MSTETAAMLVSEIDEVQPPAHLTGEPEPVTEALMPAAAERRTSDVPKMLAAMVLAALVIGLYVILPLSVAFRSILQAVPNSIGLAIGVTISVTALVLRVCDKTSELDWTRHNRPTSHTERQKHG